jgi:hypothetical protein
LPVMAICNYHCRFVFLFVENLIILFVSAFQPHVRVVLTADRNSITASTHRYNKTDVMIENSLDIKNVIIKFYLGLQFVSGVYCRFDYFRNVYELLSLYVSGNVPLNVKFVVLSAVNMKITHAWAVTPCILVKEYQHFGRNCYFRIQSNSSVIKFETAASSETSLHLYQTTRRHIPQYSTFHTIVCC